MATQSVSSREYKSMLRADRFKEARTAVAEFWKGVRALASDLSIPSKGKLALTRERQIVFLDTADERLAQNNLVLRERREGKLVQYTLKARSPD